MGLREWFDLFPFCFKNKSLLPRSRLPLPVQQVPGRQQRVAEEHARSGVAHHLADAFALVRFVAVYGAVGAGRLFGAEAAAVDALEGVGLKVGAIGAQPVNGRVVGSAVHADHQADGAALAVKARGGVGWMCHGGSIISYVSIKSQDGQAPGEIAWSHSEFRIIASSCLHF